MKNLATNKQLEKEINKAFLAMQTAKKNYVFSVINLGEKLLQARETVGFGEWEEFLNRNSEFRFEARQARKYMNVAKHKELVIVMFGDQDFQPSINQITKAISTAKATELVIDSNSESNVTQIENFEDNQSIGLVGEEDALEAEFEEVKNETLPMPTKAEPDSEFKSMQDGVEEYTELDQLRDTIQEIFQENKRLKEDNERMLLIFNDDNHTSAAIREIERLKSLNEALKNRLDGHLEGWQTERAELIKTLNHWKRRAEKAEKALEANNV